LPTGFPGLVFQAGISGTWKEIKPFSQVLARTVLAVDDHISPSCAEFL